MEIRKEDVITTVQRGLGDKVLVKGLFGLRLYSNVSLQRAASYYLTFCKAVMKQDPKKACDPLYIGTYTSLSGVITDVYKEIPEGFVLAMGAQNAPLGFTWFCNGKSRFSDDYRAVLVKTREYTELEAE